MKMKLIHLVLSFVFFFAASCTDHFDDHVSQDSASAFDSRQSAVALDAYGVWDRGSDNHNPADPDYGYLIGAMMNGRWDKIQPSGLNNFKWGELQAALQLAYDQGQWFYTKINVGDSPPQWIFDDQNVPLVKTKGHKLSEWPYYLDPNYKSLYYNLIHKFGTFLRSQPKQLREIIAFVQVQTGATGDESPYKGELTSSSKKYAISDNEWRKFRFDAFKQWKQSFIDGDPETAIPLLFNNINSEKYPEEWAWVRKNIGSKFGMKGSAYVRGHHLTGSRTFTEKNRPYTVNPDDPALFSRAEMDQSWKNPLYQLNEGLGFYWGAISGLNSGLCIWDISDSALAQATKNPIIQETFWMFNKYANQIYPKKATRAFIALHEGLDSSDTEKFPVKEYGNYPAKKSELNRYQAICDAYRKRGARMDDLKSASAGQVAQRKSQSGYNDCGWEIWPGNYSRFIEQRDPDNTSIGLFRVGVANNNIKPTSPIYSRFARSFDGKNDMEFDLHDEMFGNSDLSKGIKFTVIYYDDVKNSTWELQYYSNKGKMAKAFSVTNSGNGSWKKHEVTVYDADFGNGGTSAPDFALVNTDSQNDIFHMIEVELESEGGGGENEYVEIQVKPSNPIVGQEVKVIVNDYHDDDDVSVMRFLVNDAEVATDDSPPYSHRIDSYLDLGSNVVKVLMEDVHSNIIESNEITVILGDPNPSEYVQISSTKTIVKPKQRVRVIVDDYFDAQGVSVMRFLVNGTEVDTDTSPIYRRRIDKYIDRGPNIVKVLMEDVDGNIVESNQITVTLLKSNRYQE